MYSKVRSRKVWGGGGNYSPRCVSRTDSCQLELTVPLLIQASAVYFSYTTRTSYSVPVLTPTRLSLSFGSARVVTREGSGCESRDRKRRRRRKKISSTSSFSCLDYLRHLLFRPTEKRGSNCPPPNYLRGLSVLSKKRRRREGDVYPDQSVYPLSAGGDGETDPREKDAIAAAPAASASAAASVVSYPPPKGAKRPMPAALRPPTSGLSPSSATASATATASASAASLSSGNERICSDSKSARKKGGGGGGLGCTI